MGAVAVTIATGSRGSSEATEKPGNEYLGWVGFIGCGSARSLWNLRGAEEVQQGGRYPVRVRKWERSNHFSRQDVAEITNRKLRLLRNGAPHRINITNTCRRSYYSSNARNRRSPPSVVAFDRRRYKLTGYQLWTSHLAQLARTHVMSVFRRSCVTPPKTRSFQRPCARPPATRKSTPSFSAYSAITEASDRPLAGRC